MRREGVDQYSGWPVDLEKLTLRLTQPILAEVWAELGNVVKKVFGSNKVFGLKQNFGQSQF